MPPTEPAKDNNQKPKSSKGRRTSMIVVLIVVLAALIVGAIIINNNKSTNKTTEQPAVKPTTAKVQISSTGFEPTTIRITRGSTVTWTNTDSKPHRVASDPYPTNNGLPGFDSQQALQPNDTYSYTFNANGDFPYHDQLNPYTIKGIVSVVDRP